MLTISSTVIIWQPGNIKKTGGKGKPKPLSILIEVILILSSFFESKATLPPAVVWAGLVTQALTCTGRWVGQHQWPHSPPACQHLAAAGSGTACLTWRGTLGWQAQAWAEAQGSWPPHRLHLARELRQRLTIASAWINGNEPCSV